MYKIILDKKAIEYLKKLDNNIKERIWNKIQLCKEDPLRYVEKLTEIPGYKLRIGDYRVILYIDMNFKTIIIEKIGHRKNIYD